MSYNLHKLIKLNLSIGWFHWSVVESPCGDCLKASSKFQSKFIHSKLVGVLVIILSIKFNLSSSSLFHTPISAFYNGINASLYLKYLT